MFVPRRATGEGDAAPNGDADALRELDELEQEIRLLPESDRKSAKMGFAIFRAMSRLRKSPEGRAMAFLFDPSNMPQVDLFQTVEGRNEYRARLANLLERGTDEEARRLVRGCAWFRELSPKEQAEILRRPKQLELAAKIRSEMEPTSAEAHPAGSADSSTSSLSEEEQVRLSRVLRMAFYNLGEFDRETYIRARETEDWDTLMEFYVRIYFCFALALIPVPPGEAYGHRNRSPMLLDTDRKPCEYGGCGAPIPNMAHYCPKHSTQAKRDKDAKKKARQYSRAARLREESHAAPGGVGLMINPDGTYSGEMDPGPDIRTLRRQFQNR